ncbi:MAG: GLPGLI family protein [Tannerella sp.]|jgi:GLPGLI family protein|nr:GLPGLI family protein [Tannerella sp.]
MQKRFLIFLFLLVVLPAYAQFSKSAMDRVGGKTKKEVLDTSFLRCLYEVKESYTDKGEKEMFTDTMTLDMGKSCSVYLDRNTLFRDSVWKADARAMYHALKGQNKMLMIRRTSPSEVLAMAKQGGAYRDMPGGDKSRLYKDRKRQELTTIDYKGTLYAYKLAEKVPPQPWHIGTDTMTLLGYACQKARTQFRGRSYTAWFAPAIPLDDGPWKFYGLPGLILKVMSDDGLFSYTAIGIENSAGEVLMDRDDYIKANRKQMEKLADDNKSTLRMACLKDDNYLISEKREPWIFEWPEKE